LTTSHGLAIQQATNARRSTENFTFCGTTSVLKQQVDCVVPGTELGVTLKYTFSRVLTETSIEGRSSRGVSPFCGSLSRSQTRGSLKFSTNWPHSNKYRRRAPLWQGLARGVPRRPPHGASNVCASRKNQVVAAKEERRHQQQKQDLIRELRASFPIHSTRTST
jgi:hypothetical protein